MSDIFLIREAVPSDLEVLMTLSCECAGAPLWSEVLWRQMLDERGGRRAVLFAQQQGLCIGFVVVELVLDVVTLESIGVAPASRGMGIGYALGMAAKRWASERAAAAMQLEVRASNVAALGLYRRLGFVEQGCRRGYYTSPAEDAVLMGLQLVEGSSGTAKV